MRALALLALVPVVMWLSQTALLRRAALPFRARIGAPDLPAGLKRVNRAVTYIALVAVILGYPLLRGWSPLEYYAGFFPLGGHAGELLHGAAAAILYLALLYLAWVASDNVHFGVRQTFGCLTRRLAGAPLAAALVALVEELIFRAVLLADLLESFGPFTAIVLGAMVFAGAHYVRSVKRYWTAPGHLALGVLLCVAFVCTGALWLPVGLHAGGALVLMATRPLVRYSGPAWLVGASVFPYAGAVGAAALALLTINIWLCYGGLP